MKKPDETYWVKRITIDISGPLYGGPHGTRDAISAMDFITVKEAEILGWEEEDLQISRINGKE